MAEYLDEPTQADDDLDFIESLEPLSGRWLNRHFILTRGDGGEDGEEPKFTVFGAAPYQALWMRATEEHLIVQTEDGIEHGFQATPADSSKVIMTWAEGHDRALGVKNG